MTQKRTLSRGILISLEGIDGSGKTALANMLGEHFRAEGVPVILTKEPGGTAFGNHMRSLLHDRPYVLCPEAEFLLFAADRAQHIAEVVKPALEQKCIVISDRMADSSQAYQGFGRGLDKEYINKINSWVMSGIKPDIVLYLNIDYETASKRLALRNQKLTPFEREQAAFFKRVTDGFNTIFKERPEVVVIDASRDFDQVANQVLMQMKAQLLPLLESAYD